MLINQDMTEVSYNLFINPTFLAALSGWIVAQGAKMIIFFIKKGKFNISFIASTGGMPSAHSSMVSALATSVALRTGMDSAVFAVTLAFALVVMFDAQSVRRAAGLQAHLLNQLIEELFKEHKLSEQKLVELLGHTRLEVVLGMIMGLLTALLIHSF